MRSPAPHPAGVRPEQSGTVELPEQQEQADADGNDHRGVRDDADLLSALLAVQSGGERQDDDGEQEEQVQPDDPGADPGHPLEEPVVHRPEGGDHHEAEQEGQVLPGEQLAEECQRAASSLPSGSGSSIASNVSAIAMTASEKKTRRSNPRSVPSVSLGGALSRVAAVTAISVPSGARYDGGPAPADRGHRADPGRTDQLRPKTFRLEPRRRKTVSPVASWTASLSVIA
ncbi:hypothetical protein GCM10027614_43570 [Micromonospora vulcania]